MTGPAEIPILFDDGALLAAVKPHGLPVVPSRDDDGTGETLRRLLEARFGPLLVIHRLDAGTGGVVLLARDPALHRDLSLRFERGEVAKTYLAVAAGHLARPETLTLPISRRNQAGRYRINFTSGRPAVTEFEPLEANERATLVACRPRTGRTHQIRVHLKALGHPLAQDWLYRAPDPDRRLPLFAARVEFPYRGDRLALEAPPSDFLRETAKKFDLVYFDR